MSEPTFPWTWRDALGLWFYNWVRRPWSNLLWDLGKLSPDPLVREFFRTNSDRSPRSYPRAGKLSRETMEWALRISRRWEGNRP